jgi:L-ascorbate metabolism protein UlaG (beta-lactamase superfamily)
MGDQTAGSVQFIGTATVLIRYAGFTLLTDPNFLHRGQRVRLGYGLRATRLTEPALSIADLPPLDLIVLSHLHEDHFDRIAERDLDHRLPILTTRDAARVLRGKGFGAARPLRTWQAFTANKGGAQLRITAMPGKHGPGPMTALLPTVMGSMLDFSRPDGQPLLRLYVTGDTLMNDPRLRQIPQRYPDIDLALLHLGGTKVMGLTVTMDARQGVAMLRLVRPRMAIPIHYNDYDCFKSPLGDFQRAVQQAGLEHHVQYLAHGESFEFDVPEA